MQPPGPRTRISELEGQSLGPYQVVELLGRGGMAVVYKALQPTLRRYVAIKVLPPAFALDPTFRSRFQQEAETIARLQHPNILPIYDYGQDGDLPYLVMPLVTGGTLRTWLAGRPPLARVVPVLLRLLDALDYAHRQRVVHRDLKPSNVLLGPGEWPLLADFGIAKLAESTAVLTHSGGLVGTPEYMAPEQCEGRAVDARTDLYAMGVILYEVLTGRLPFTGSTPLAVILSHLRDDPPPLRTVTPAVGPAWEAVVQRCLAKQPEARFGSAAELAAALEAAWREEERRGAGKAETLYAQAVAARATGAWEQVISLCVELLAEAHAALRRQREAQQATQRRLPSSPTPSAVPETAALQTPPLATVPPTQEAEPPATPPTPVAGSEPPRPAPPPAVPRGTGSRTQLALWGGLLVPVLAALLGLLYLRELADRPPPAEQREAS